MNNTEKHAYLIMAHNNFEQLKCLISLLDDPRNDIYLHIDKKIKTQDLNIRVKSSKLIMVDPIKVTWGGHSQIKCEMKLFSEAAAKNYSYYHLLSGVDLPLKTQDEIHSFFNGNKGLNFISYDTSQESHRNRVQYYHVFRNFIGKKKGAFWFLLKLIDIALVEIQKFFHLRRREFIPICKGSNWVSITNDMVKYLVSKKKLIKKQFYYSFCADEVFLQSVAKSSPYCDTIVNDGCRLIDWVRGNPYTFLKEDVQQLLSSSALFARKFDETVDSEVIDIIAQHLKEKSLGELR